MTLEDLDQGFVNLIFFALDHGIESVRDSNVPLIPFVVVENESGERNLQRFVAERLERCVEQAMEFAKKIDASSRVVVSYEGFVTADGVKTDAVVVVGRERGTLNTVSFAQRYTPKKFLKKFQTVGNAVFLGRGPSFG